ncbi:MAG: hypothetical protein AAB880_01475 [Patescibacteria group bacterium]
MTETTEQKKVRFLVFAPEDAVIYGLGLAVLALRDYAWAEVTRTTDPEIVRSELLAKKVNGLILIRPETFDPDIIERVFLQWVSVCPEETYILLLAEWPTFREAAWANEWDKNIRFYGGFSNLQGNFHLFGEFVRSNVK